MFELDWPAIFTSSLVPALILLLLLISWPGKHHTLDEIPTVGFSAPLLSYITAFRFISHAHLWLEEGYQKYKPGLFRIAMLDHWHVFVTSRQLVEDVAKAQEHVLSFHEASRSFLQTDYTLGPELLVDPFHVPILQAQLTRALTTIFGDMYDELEAAFKDTIPGRTDWTQVPAQQVLRQIVCSVSNRVFVGAPVCRNREYQQINIDFFRSVVERAWIINRFPKFLRPLVRGLVSDLRTYTRQQSEHLKPLIDERRMKAKEYGKDWERKPNDMLMWSMQAAKDVSVAGLSRRMLAVNSAAVHTTSMTLTHALYHLANGPDYVQPLREEVEAAVASEGWTKAALGKMRKVDNFLRESQRIHGTNTSIRSTFIVTLKRLALKPFTFSNEITVPTGTVISCPIRALHIDDTIYPNSDVFDGYRFANLRESESTKHQLATTTPEYLAVAHGKFACPGRFFAAYVLKTILAHVVLNYDIKFKEGHDFPLDRFVGTTCAPGQADLLSRKR
ncbi:cytochrome P450, partial [Artomyces pyxidatus]